MTVPLTYNVREPGPSPFQFAITPSDSASNNFTQTIRGIYVGTAGNFVAVQPDGSTVTFVGALAGNIYPVQCVRINSTSTTASNLVGLV